MIQFLEIDMAGEIWINKMNVLYIQKHFPVLSETFVLNEICRLIDLKHNVFIASMFKVNELQVHDEIKKYNLLEKVFSLRHYCPYKGEVGQIFTKLDIFRKFGKEFFNNKNLSFQKKLSLLKFCYEGENNLEVPFRKFLDYLDLIKFIQEKKIDYLHCHFAAKNVKLAYVLNKIIGVPYVFTTYAYDIYFEPEVDLRLWAESAKKIITTSEYNRRYMVKKFGIPSERIEVVYSGIFLDKFKQINLKRDKKFTILNVGRLHEVKGQKYLVEACGLLKKKGESFQCWIIGEGEERVNLEKQICELGLEEEVKLLGAKKNSELLDFYNKADVFVLPSISESMGLVNMEALACGVPVIASNVRGVPELVKDKFNGFLIEPKTPEEITKKILELKYNGALKKEFKKNARKIVLGKFDIKKNVGQLSEILGLNEVGDSVRSLLVDCCSLCQLTCPACPDSLGHYKINLVGRGYLKFTNFKKLVDDNSQIKSIELSGYGEMFLNPELEKIVEYAYEKGVSLSALGGVNFNTASKTMIESLVKYGFNAMTISIDGATNSVYKKYRRGGDLTKVLKNIRLLNKYKKEYGSEYPKLKWQFIVFGHNEKQLPLARKMASELGMDFKTKLNWSSWYSPIKDPEFVKKNTLLGVSNRKEFENKFKKTYMSACKGVWSRPNITWKGDLLGCCFNKAVSFGNVFEEGLRNCLEGKRYKRLKNVLDGKEKVGEDLPCFNCPSFKEIILKNSLGQSKNKKLIKEFGRNSKKVVEEVKKKR